MALIFQPLWYRGFSRELPLVDFLHYLTLQDFLFFFFGFAAVCCKEFTEGF